MEGYFVKFTKGKVTFSASEPVSERETATGDTVGHASSGALKRASETAAAAS